MQPWLFPEAQKLNGFVRLHLRYLSVQLAQTKVYSTGGGY